MKASARARSNIALIKYWGKRDVELNLPAVGSLSITLNSLWSDTTVSFSDQLKVDEFVLDGKQQLADHLVRVSACLDLLRARAGIKHRARIESSNNFPTAAGLASSASGFAALVVAADAALGLSLPKRELSIIARRGSGSAARSIFGGFVDMRLGTQQDGSDCYAEPLLAENEWPLEVVVAITARSPKAISSGAGMTYSASQSPYYSAWVKTHPPDLDTAKRAIAARDFALLADVSESSCLKMHAAAIATIPSLLYWNGVTVECMHAIQALRKQGNGVFFTIDAGPQVKAICLPEATETVASTLSSIPGVQEIIRTGLGPGAEIA